MKSNITILICLIVLTLSCANKPELTWQELYEQNWDDSYFITLNEVKDRNTLIVYSNIRFNEQEEDKKKLDKLLSIYKDKLLNDKSILRPDTVAPKKSNLAPSDATSFCCSDQLPSGWRAKTYADPE